SRVTFTHHVDHASGRPWIVGSWSERDIAVFEAGPRKLVLFGTTSTDERRVVTALGHVDHLDALDGLASRLPGLFHLCASIDGASRTQGSISGACQVFSTEVDGLMVAASSVGMLVRLAGRHQLDETELAARLLAPAGPPWPLFLNTTVRGIQTLMTGHW